MRAKIALNARRQRELTPDEILLKMKSLLAQIANELILSGASKDAAARIACSVVLKQLTENDMDLAKAFDLVFGDGAYRNFANEIFNEINA